MAEEQHQSGALKPTPEFLAYVLGLVDRVKQAGGEISGQNGGPIEVQFREPEPL